MSVPYELKVWLGTSLACLNGCAAYERDARKREERQQSAEREIGEPERSGERKSNKCVERAAVF
jgi:hypothetical protein